MKESRELLKLSPISCFADEIAESLDRQIEVLLDLGIRWIELRSADGINIAAFTTEYANMVKKKLDAAGIRVSAVGSPIGKISIEEDFDTHKKSFHAIQRLADIFETPLIRIFSFYLPKEQAPGKYRDAVMMRMDEMVQEAAQNRLTLLHENEKGIYGDTADRCLDLMKQFAGESFRCTFDFANFIQCGQDTWEAYQLLKPFLSYVHIKDALSETKEIVPAGKGDGHLAQILSAMDTDGYRGFLSLEPHLADFSGFRGLEQDAAAKAEHNTEKTFRIAYDALLQLLS